MPMSDQANTALAESLLHYLTDSDSESLIREMHLHGSGPVAALEDKLKSHFGVRYALCVSNATTGLLAIGMALNLKRAEFVTTPFTYGATVAGWLQLDNKPRFADIDPDTLTLDPASVDKSISRKTKAILSADIFGSPADQAELRRVANEHGLWFISDAAQSLGAYRDGLPASSLADASVVSFTVGKSVFAGEGGAILTNNEGLYEKLLWHSQHPCRQRRELGLHFDNEFALNGRIHPLAAIWANAVFDESIEKLRSHQGRCFRIIESLNTTGLTERINLRDNNIEPCFFRLTAAWAKEPRETVLLSSLAEAGFSVGLGALPVRLLYQQPAFIAQYRKRIEHSTACREAKSQIRKRFCVLH